LIADAIADGLDGYILPDMIAILEAVGFISRTIDSTKLVPILTRHESGFVASSA
jgi:hypothetical protein